MKMLESSVLFRVFRGFVYKRYSDTFFYLFSEKGKDKLHDKSTACASRTMAVVCLSGVS